MPTIYDVAQHIRQLRPKLTVLELQKLCYLSQGWSSAWSGSALFPEPMEAWKWGPANPFLDQKAATDNDNYVIGLTPGNASQLTAYENAAVEHVVDFYSNTSGFTFSEISHGAAWTSARGSRAADAPGSEPIPWANIRAEFTKKLWSATNIPSAPTIVPATDLQELLEASKKVEAENFETLRLLAHL